MKIVLKDEGFAIIGACFEVHNAMGCGFLESVYGECLGIELGLRDIPVREQHQLALSYKGRLLKSVFVPDFICFDSVVVEIKAVTSLAEIHRAQVHNYLKATGYRLGLLINFNSQPQLEWERIVR
jgi:GxxExxY protein